jgi:CRP-like cAMP-binding protein
MGECTVLLDGMQIARVADLFGQKFPELAPGSTMSISFYRITATELDFIDNTTGSTVSELPEGTFGADFHRERSYSVIMDLPVRPAQSILVSLQSMAVAAGEAIVRQGTPADKFFVIVDGEVELVRDEGAGETPVASLTPGQLFGEVAIMRDQPRTATARAKTDVKLYALERETFKDLIAQSMEITPDFDQVIRARLDAQGHD